VLAENQIKVASGLKDVGAAALIANNSPWESQFEALLSQLLADQNMLSTMSVASAGIVNGMGKNLVISQMMN
jgi:spore coat polysaccharide biosynthesis predicted glycosyltransferase SpsG